MNLYYNDNFMILFIMSTYFLNLKKINLYFAMNCLKSARNNYNKVWIGIREIFKKENIWEGRNEYSMDYLCNGYMDFLNVNGNFFRW